MPKVILEFEKPVYELLQKLDEMKLLGQTLELVEETRMLEAKVEEFRRDLYGNLTPWQRVQMARHPERPYLLDFIEMMTRDFVELHGDRKFGDDHAIVGGFADLDGQTVMCIGQQKGRDTKQNLFRNFGMPKPEGYRKALRAMKLAEKYQRAVIAFIDTPAAYPGVESEERGIAEAIAFNLREMAALNAPIIVVVHGEGGSGGALGIAIGDRILMHEFAIYSVIPPEGCAAILWRDASRKVEAAEALRLTAPDLQKFGVIDEIVAEPVGGAHTDHERAAALLDAALMRALAGVWAMEPSERLDARYRKFRAMGNIGINES